MRDWLLASTAFYVPGHSMPYVLLGAFRARFEYIARYGSGS